MADLCGYKWRTWGAGPCVHNCVKGTGHGGKHRCKCGAITSGTDRQTVPDDGPGPTPPPGPSSPPDGGVGAPPGPHDPSPDAATSSPTPPSPTADDYVRATAESLGLDADAAVAYRQELPADERARDRFATNPDDAGGILRRDRCTATHDAPVPSGPSGSRREPIAPPTPRPSPAIDLEQTAAEYRAMADDAVFHEWLRLRGEPGRYMDAEEAAECFRTIVLDTDPVRRAMALSSLAAMAGYAVVGPPVVEQLPDVLRALRDRVPTEEA